MRAQGPIHNVILISIDTLRADHLGSYGYKLPTSPNLDAFAAKSVRFEDCHSASGHTLSSHKSLLSGRYASSFLSSFSGRGGPRQPTRDNLDYYRLAFALWPTPGLAPRLHESGFATRAWTDGGYVRSLYGFGIGFDEYGDERLGIEAHRKQAEAWIREHAQGPFFVFLHCYDVHCPYDPPEKFLRMFESSCTGRLQFKATCGKPYFNSLDLTGEEKAHIARHYDAGIRHADDELGKFFAFLRSSGRMEDTLIVITSDHGESLGERAFVGHGELYDNQLHVPLIVSAPGFAPGIVEAPVAGIDVMPTVLDLLGGSVPADVEGWSLRGLMKPAAFPNSQAGASRHAASDFDARPRFASITVNEGPGDETRLRKIAVQDRSGFKLICDLVSGRRELYDLSADPLEARNLAGTGRPEEEVLVRLAAGHDPGALKGLDPKAAPRKDEEALTPELKEELRSLGYVH